MMSVEVRVRAEGQSGTTPNDPPQGRFEEDDV